MAPRPRKSGNRDLPPNLYRQTIKGVDYYQYRDPRTGKYSGLGQDKALAVADAITLNAEIYSAIRERRREQVERSTGPSLRTYLGRYWELVTVNPRKPLATNTLRHRSYIVDVLREHPHSAIPVESFEVLHVGEILAEYTARDKQRMALSVRSVLVDVFRHALAEGVRPLADGNPAEASLMPHAPVKRARLTLDRWRTIYEAASDLDPWVRNAMLLGLVTAQRREDISLMEFSSISEGRLHVVQGKVKGKAAGRTGTPLRLSLDIRLEAIGISIGDAIRQCRDDVVSRRLIHHTRRTTHAKPGDPVHRDTISRGFARARELSGVTWDGPPPTYHEIRSLSARLYGAQGNVDVQALLGHKDASTTDVYRDARGHEWVDVGVL